LSAGVVPETTSLPGRCGRGSPFMEPCEEARQLLLGAEKDLRALAGMREPEVFAEEIFGFHAQQAVEKCLKAWITLFGAEYPRTHDLSFLLSRLESLGERVEEFEDPC